MNADDEKHKRLFFAFDIETPWPEELPKGRLLKEENRHLTFVFLGWTSYTQLQPLLPTMPLPPFKVGLSGRFDKTVFLPKSHPRVVAWHISWLDDPLPLNRYRRVLTEWLQGQGFNPDDREELLFHVTLCRAPFDFNSWRDAFREIPLFIKSLHLYESVGQLRYQAVWSHHLLIPFEELDHTADIAFKVRGDTISQLFFNALTALVFKYPELIKYSKGIEERGEIASIDEVIIRLNQVVSRADAEIGCPFKAISFHGEIEQIEGSLTWEMIVDV